MKHFEVRLVLKPGAKPKFCRPRPVLYALCEAIEHELDRLDSDCVVERVSWVAPIVAVPKQDGSVRTCGDYKATFNPTLDVDQYLPPRPEDLMTCPSGGP